MQQAFTDLREVNEAISKTASLKEKRPIQCALVRCRSFDLSSFFFLLSSFIPLLLYLFQTYIMRVIILFVALALAGCGAKQARQEISSGNYDRAIEIAVDGLRSNKDKKGKQDYVYMLEEAFAKAKQRDEHEVALLAKDASPASFEKVYNTYLQMHRRQEMIRPLLPLKLIRENRNAIFPFEDYSDQIVSSKNALAKYLYDKASKLVATTKKEDARAAFEELLYLEQVSPGFKDSAKLRERAREAGMDYVSIYLKNDTPIMIPSRLEADLLNFGTTGLNDRWATYHANRLKDIDYDYGIVINFRDIKVSPEQIKEKEFRTEREIKAGMKKLLDRNGNVVKDSLGNPIMVPNMKKVVATVYEFRQFKACQVTAKVDYIDFDNNQMLQSFPIASEFIFENIYSRIRGDKRAVDEQYLQYIGRPALPFPTSEQMVYDTGEDLKAKIKAVIAKNRITRR